MRYLSLFSGAGGGDLGCQHLLGWECVGYVEWEEYPCKVLEARIEDGMLSDAPIWNCDIREFNERTAEQYRGVADCVTGGFPCQPFSVAGKRKGADDERNMWPATLDTIRRVRPEWCMLENVPGLVTKKRSYLDRIVADLHEVGYDSRWGIVSAADVGAPHLRKRLWIVAHSVRSGGRQDAGSAHGDEAPDEGRTTEHSDESQRDGEGRGAADVADASRDVAGREVERPVGERTWQRGECSWWDVDPADVGDSDGAVGGQPGGASEEVRRSEALERSGRSSSEGGDVSESTGEQVGSAGQSREDAREHAVGQPEPRVGRVAYGVAHRVDRLKALGNGQVPLVAAVAWDRLHRDLIG